MEKIAEIKNESAADQRGTTAPSQSGEHVISGGPRAVAGREQIVMAGNVRRAGCDATQKFGKSKRQESAWWFWSVRKALGLTTAGMADLMGCVPNTIGNYEDEELGTLPDHKRRALEDVVSQRGLADRVAQLFESRKRSALARTA